MQHSLLFRIEFLQALFAELGPDNESQQKNIRLKEYVVKTVSIPIDTTSVPFILGLRSYDGALVLFHREMMGSVDTDHLNVFDDEPCFQIIPENKKEGFYWELNVRRTGSFPTACRVGRQISILSEKFMEAYNSILREKIG